MSTPRTEAARFRARLAQNEADLGAQLGLRDALIALDDPEARYETKVARWHVDRLVEAVVGGEREALHPLELAMEERPDDAALVWAAAGACRRAGDLTRAIELYLTHQELVPDWPFTAFLIDACRGSGAPSGAPHDYLRALGAEIAEYYEYHMADIEDGMPQLVAEVVRKTAGGAPLELVDLGCGTGLVGSLIRPVVKRMTGVDISSEMLDRARALKIYDRLLEAEAVAFLEAHEQAFNRVLASDMLCYSGSLKAFVAGAAFALRRGGKLIFSVEPGPEPFQLTPYGRFTHGPSHIEKCAKAARMTIESVEEVPMRKEEGRVVHGLIYVLKKG